MIIQLDFESEIPIYLQVKNQIIEGIATGDLVPGEALPSIRSLAADIGVNMHTINKSYQLLKQDGFIVINRKKGVVVHSNPPKADNDFLIKLEENIRPLIAEAVCREMEKDEWNKLCQTIFEKIKE